MGVVDEAGVEEGSKDFEGDGGRWGWGVGRGGWAEDVFFFLKGCGTAGGILEEEWKGGMFYAGFEKIVELCFDDSG